MLLPDDYDPLLPTHPIAEHQPGKDIVPSFEVDRDGDLRIHLTTPRRDLAPPWEDWEVDAVRIARNRALVYE